MPFRVIKAERNIPIQQKFTDPKLYYIKRNIIAVTLDCQCQHIAAQCKVNPAFPSAKKMLIVKQPKQTGKQTNKNSQIAVLFAMQKRKQASKQTKNKQWKAKQRAKLNRITYDEHVLL